MSEPAPAAVAAATSRLYAARPILAASLAVFRGDRVLLAQRAVPPAAGRFTLPGGVVEPGEHLAEAALRECLEEVGVEARILGFNRHAEVIERDEAGAVRRHFVIASFVGAWVAGEGVPGPEAAAVVWARLAELDALEVTDGLAPVLAAAWDIAQRMGGAPC